MNERRSRPANRERVFITALEPDERREGFISYGMSCPLPPNASKDFCDGYNEHREMVISVLTGSNL